MKTLGLRRPTPQSSNPSTRKGNTDHLLHLDQSREEERTAPFEDAGRAVPGGSALDARLEFGVAAMGWSALDWDEIDEANTILLDRGAWMFTGRGTISCSGCRGRQPEVERDLRLCETVSDGPLHIFPFRRWA